MLVKYLFIPVFIAGLILLFSCTDEKSNSSLNKNLKVVMIKHHKKSAGCESGQIDNCAEIKIEYPRITFNNKDVEDKINSSIFRLFAQGMLDSSESVDFESIMNRFISEYESFKKEFPDAPQSWIIERTGKVMLNKANIISMDCTDYSYTGGAHPNTFVTFKNFNLSTGREFQLVDLIHSEKLNELRQIAEVEFRKLKNLKSDDDLGKAGFWFEDNQFKLNDNFLIADSSLIFYYNNYEITAYAFGPTELVIPYQKIKNLVEQISPLSSLIN